MIVGNQIISAQVSKGTEQNKTAIGNIVSQFVQGKVAEGIVATLFTALDVILGTFAATYN